MKTFDQDMLARIATIDWVKKQSIYYNNSIPRQVLKDGFKYNNKSITLVNQPGIWKPALFDYPISITTTLRSKYFDKQHEDYLEYSYCSDDPYYRDNIGLRNLMQNQRPLIYFLETAQKYYCAQFPAYIIGDDISNLKFKVAFDELDKITYNVEVSDIKRQYITREVKQRIHQTVFREQVLHAYKCQCTFCRLRYKELLDAAHIIPDSKERGDAIVTNGLSLCKIHHAAFDKNIVGITPDYKIKVRKDILDEIDGPMLKHGIQELDNQKIILPYYKKDWPDPSRLDERYRDFVNC